MLIRSMLMACLLFLPAVCTGANMTGRWTCDDGGIYYMRQTGKLLYWYAENNNDVVPAWTTVFHGRIYGKQIHGKWADVPKGRHTGSGDLKLMVEDDGNTLRKLEKDSDYRGALWTRLDRNNTARRPLKRLRPSGEDTCMEFTPSAVQVRQLNNRWLLVEGDHWLFDFGDDQPAARKAFTVINHYRMDRACFIGNPDTPAFSYFLARGGSPYGAMAGESCMTIDLDHLTLSDQKGRWEIASGKRRLFDFGKSQARAAKAMALIRRHGFTHTCRVGSRDAGFGYLRK